MNVTPNQEFENPYKRIYFKVTIFPESPKKKIDPDETISSISEEDFHREKLQRKNLNPPVNIPVPDFFNDKKKNEPVNENNYTKGGDVDNSCGSFSNANIYMKTKDTYFDDSFPLLNSLSENLWDS